MSFMEGDPITHSGRQNAKLLTLSAVQQATYTHTQHNHKVQLLGLFGPFGPFLGLMGLMGLMGLFGPFWAFWVLWAQWALWALWVLRALWALWVLGPWLVSASFDEDLLRGTLMH